MSRVSSFLLLGPPRSQGMAGVGGSCGDTGLNCHQREVLVSTPGSAGGEAGRGAGCVLPARAGARDKVTLWEVNLRGCRDSGVPLCIPANPHLPPGSCFQVAKRLFPCVSLSLGFEKEISKQMEKDGPGIFPVSVSCFLLPHLQGGSGRLCRCGAGAAVPVRCWSGRAGAGVRLGGAVGLRDG